MSWKEECGVFGIWNHPDAARLSYLGLFAMQHRGQESAGIVSLDEGDHHHHKGLGLVGDVFKEEDLKRLSGRVAIGHVRYSTTGQNLLTNAQPLTAHLLHGPVAIAHNGNFVNHESLRQQLREQGAIFQGTNDTEILLHLLSKHESRDLVTALRDSVQKLVGAYSLMIMSRQELVVARDPYGFRPLVMGELNLEKTKISDSSSNFSDAQGAKCIVFASETCAFDLIGAHYVRDVEPGEILHLTVDGLRSLKLSNPGETAHCIFEHIYFSRPDSMVFGKSVYGSRKRFGAQLAKERPILADLVIPVPDSGVPAALGYSEASGIPFEMGIIRNHYIGRTFIQPHQSIRDFGVRIKLNALGGELRGKKVVVIDDSLVRGTTSRKIIAMIRQAGAQEVHMCIASPPTVGPCYYGVDTPHRAHLIAADKAPDEIRDFIGADTLTYLSQEGLFSAMNVDAKSYCAACFTRKYPTMILETLSGDSL